MRKQIAKKHDKKKRTLYRNFIELVAVGSVTGVFAGAFVTLFTILAHEGEKISHDAYAYVRGNPAFIPLLLLVVFLGGFFISVAARITSVIKGCGIPQVEGGTRGIVRFKWYRDLVAMFSATLMSIFMGLSIGAEGPSAFIGACAGDGIATMFHSNEMIRRYQLTGGSCAGLAVASNAPLTGMAFAFEEAHKRFTPEVFICAFSSVIFGMFTRIFIYSSLGMQTQSIFHSYLFYELPIYHYGLVVLAGVVCGLFGVVFYKACFKIKRFFEWLQKKKSKFTDSWKIITVALVGSIISLIAVGVMGGGHELIESIGTLGGVYSHTSSLIWMLVAVLVLKLIVTALNVGASFPCGVFIPIIAIGACLGGILNYLWATLGMDAKYYDLMVMICMAAFFTTVVKAPITSIIMICEFTGSFAPLLPVIIAVSIGYLIGEMMHTDGIYDDLLEEYERDTGMHRRAVKELFVMTLAFGALADKREVKDILWPAGARVQEISRGEERIIPDGDTILYGGDVLTIIVTTEEPKKAQEDLLHILG